MAIIKSVRGFTPKIGEDCFLAENAAIIGDVLISCREFVVAWSGYIVAWYKVKVPVLEKVMTENEV